MKTEKWQWITYSALFIFFLFSLLYFFYGRLNADEGWFLYASRLVYEGKIPYRDFAFTQMPLLPYIYGLSSLAGMGLYGGRFISLTLSITGIVISVLAAYQLGGKSAAAMTATLAASVPIFIYFLVVVKVYALTTFFFQSFFMH